MNGGFSLIREPIIRKVSLILMGKASSVYGNDASEMTCFRFD